MALKAGIHAVDAAAEIGEFGANPGKAGLHIVGEAADQFGDFLEILRRHLYIPIIVVSGNGGNFRFLCGDGVSPRSRCLWRRSNRNFRPRRFHLVWTPDENELEDPNILTS